MDKAGRYLLLPLTWVNITTAANGWKLIGVGIGQLLYWLMIGLVWYLASHSPYRRLVNVMLCLALALRMLEPLVSGEIVTSMRVITLGGLFILAGTIVYGRHPFLLHRQLVIFLALCIPIMLLQILGVSSKLMVWNTEYAHDLSILTVDEIGSFKTVPVYPTLFLGVEELDYLIGQGRPVGLMYSNNVLSFFVAIAVGLNLAIPRNTRLRMSDITVTGALVLAMSKMAFAVVIILYIYSLVFGVPARRSLVLKLFALLALVLLLYYFLFPGLFLSHVSEAKFWSSVIPRVFDLSRTLGVDSIINWLNFEQTQFASSYDESETYSGVARVLKSQFAVPVVFIMAAASLLYVYRIRQMIAWPTRVYTVTLIVCVLTQLGVPFIGAASFQLIAGFALFPLFMRLRRSRPAHRLSGIRVEKQIHTESWATEL